MKDEPIILNPPKKKRAMGKKKNFGFVIFILVFLALVVAVPYYLLVPKKEAFKLRDYEIATVGVRDFTKTVSASGTVVAGEKASVIALADGTVVQVLVKPGDIVKKGDLLVELSSEDLKENLQKVQAQYQKNLKARSEMTLENVQKMQEIEKQIEDSTSQYARLKREFPAWEKLYKLGEISQASFEDEKKKLDDAAQAVTDAKSQKQYTIQKQRINIEDAENTIRESLKVLNQAQARMQACQIRATLGGKIVSLGVDLGEELKTGKTVADIINEESLQVEGKVELSDIQDVREGQPVRIQAGGLKYEGQVTYVSPVADESKVKINVKFTSVPTNLRSQASVSLDVETGVLKGRLSLPRGRYLSSGNEKYVYLIQGKKAVKTQVAFGLVNDDYIEVRDGLREGDTIITSSYDDFIHLDEIDLNEEGGTKI